MEKPIGLANGKKPEGPTGKEGRASIGFPRRPSVGEEIGECLPESRRTMAGIVHRSCPSPAAPPRAPNRKGPGSTDPRTNAPPANLPWSMAARDPVIKILGRHLAGPCISNSGPRLADKRPRRGSRKLGADPGTCRLTCYSHPRAQPRSSPHPYLSRGALKLVRPRHLMYGRRVARSSRARGDSLKRKISRSINIS
jgi:hypothetical protein